MFDLRHTIDSVESARLAVSGAAAPVRLLVAALLIAAPLPVAAGVQSERLTYKLMVGGLHLGDALVALNETEAGYTTELKMTARGVARWVKNFRTDMKGEGHFAPTTAGVGLPALAPRPGTYIRQWSAGEVAANMTMTFDPATGMARTEERLFNPLTGADIAAEDLPWNSRGRNRDQRRRPVPPDLRTNVLDPMAAFVAARGQIMAQDLAVIRNRLFRVPIYDGRRRYDIVGRAEAARAVTINGIERLVTPVIATLKPIFGFGARSEERMRTSEGKFFFTADDRFIPVQVTVSNEMFSGVMNLTADCSQDPAPCDTFGQEPVAE